MSKVLNFVCFVFSFFVFAFCGTLSALGYSIKFVPGCLNMHVSVNEGINVSRHVKVFFRK